MIVDDSLTVRTIFKRMVEGDPSLTVTATASSAEQAIKQLKTAKVDVLLLDLEMPGMGGLEALPVLLDADGETQILVVSSLTNDGAEATISALSMGAADTMLKPRPGGFNDEYRSLLLGKIRALGGEDAPGSDTRKATPSPAIAQPPLVCPEVIAIGASTGGIHAINKILDGLTADFDLPILITQHLPASFVEVFARQLESSSGRQTVIAEEGTVIAPRTIAIATGHGHMIIRRERGQLVSSISAEPAPSGCLPSVDPMFQSLAATCEGRVLALLLSGMGRDGAQGAQAIADAGGVILAQDAETSAVWGMPGAVAKAGIASLVATPEKLAEAIVQSTGAPTAAMRD